MVSSYPQATALLILADGTSFWGQSEGVAGHIVGELVFHTGMTGYQEILTDPSYFRQLISFTYPHIGNVGANSEDFESRKVFAAGAIFRSCRGRIHNPRAQMSFHDFLHAQGVVAISGVDTRALVHHIQQSGPQNACVMTGEDLDRNLALQQARSCPSMQGLSLAAQVSCQEPYLWSEGSGPHIVVYDFGVKYSILRALSQRGCRVTVIPAHSPAAFALAIQADGFLLSNGPGDPSADDRLIQLAKTLLDSQRPILGICLGHQILALAAGARTRKMLQGHHGANHPVLDRRSGRVLISSQNHGFCVDEQGLPTHMEITHHSLFDQTIQGYRVPGRAIMGFQGHPEAGPGPQELSCLFDEWLNQVRSLKQQNAHTALSMQTGGIHHA
jgi:carbamoyl-phosphate synthase small subunit